MYTNASWDFGHIARPDNVCSNGCFGTLHISDTRPRLTITGIVNTPAAGETLDKVGMTTGWTDGRVNHTCMDVDYPSDYIPQNVTLKCQYSVRAGSDHGDSGAAVFRNYDWPNGDHVYLYGILGGSWNNSTAEFGFSPMGSILSTNELGPMTVY